MARERYLIGEDEQSFVREKKAELTPKQKRQNFWHYNGVKILSFVIIIGIIGAYVYSVVKRVKPDYTVALITQTNYSDEIVAQIGAEFEKHGEDRNGDGKVSVYINTYQYLLGQGADTMDTDAVMMGITRVIADCEACESLIFITDEQSFINILPNLGTSFFVNYKTGEEVEDELTDFSDIRAPYSSWKAFDSFLINYEEMEGIKPEKVTSTYMDRLSMSVRVVEGTKHEKSEKKMASFSDSLALVKRIIEEQ